MRDTLRGIGLAVAVLAIGLWAVPGLAQELAKEQRIRISIPVADIKSLDPAFATLTGEKEIVGSMTNGLLRFPTGKLGIEKVEGDLAERWTVSPDGLTWTFSLRKGVKFHKGFGELSADDVKFTFDRMLNPATGSPWITKYHNLAAVEVVNPLTVRIKLKKADPFFAFNVIGYHGGQIVSKKAVEKFGKDIAFNPIGTGPFVFEAYTKGQGVTLKRNQDYFRGAPILEQVNYIFMPDDSSRMLAMQKGDVDLGTGVRRKEWAERATKMGMILMPPDPPQQSIVIFNMKRKPLDDLRVRQALAYALDREVFVDLLGPILGGPQISSIPPGYFGHTEEGLEPYNYNPEKAKKLLAEAGYPNGFDLGDVAISKAWDYLEPMKIIQEYWRKVGVNFNLKVVDHPTYHKLIREDANPVVIYGGVRLPIASSLLSEFYSKDAIVGKPTAITNFSHYGEVIPGIDEYLEKAEATTNLKEKERYFKLAQEKINKDLPAHALFLNRVELTRQKWVDLGYDTKPYETLYYVIEITEKTKILKH